MIQFFNRKTQKLETEKVYGDAFVKFLYQNPIGLVLTKTLFPKKTISKAMGLYQDTKASAKAIPEFIKLYEIPMSEYEEQTYTSFNDFFIRKFRPGKRCFIADEDVFCAGAEARYLAVENLTAETRFPVKGIEINLAELLGPAVDAKDFLGGTLIIARLCPVDYHRFHFPVSGEQISFQELAGELDSVNPVALESLPKVLFKNERHVAIFENPVFGKIAMIEVGAMGVGRIIQEGLAQEKQLKFDKGQEKGYFLFGGSTVIWVVQPERLQLDADLVRNSGQGIETWIPLGDRLGGKKTGGKTATRSSSGSASTADH